MNEEVTQAMDELVEQLREQHPDLVDIMDAMKCGELDQERGMKLITDYTVEHPELEANFMATAGTALAPLRAGDAVFPTGEVPEGVMQTDQDRLPRLNPLYEAALAERAQFDGDMPELRTGPMVEGVKAAVSIQSDARDPAILGTLLEGASEQVTRQVETHEQVRHEQIREIAENPLGTLALIQRAASNLTRQETPDIVDMVRGTAETDLATYRRGELPALMAMVTPPGAALAKMTGQERREGAWKFLSTTQGRRSAVDTILKLVAECLVQRGFDVEEHDLGGVEPKEHRGKEMAQHLWRVNLAGVGATQPSFSLIDVAARVLAAQLARQVEPQTVALEVWPVNTIADREVGWGARLLQPAVLG